MFRCVGLLRAIPRYAGIPRYAERAARTRAFSCERVLPPLNFTLVNTAGTFGSDFIDPLADGDVLGAEQVVNVRTMDPNPVDPELFEDLAESRNVEYLGAVPMTNLKEGFQDAHVVVATSTGTDLEKEAEQFAKMGKALRESASRDLQVFVVGKYAHTLSMVLSSNLGRDFQVDQVVAASSPDFEIAYDHYESIVNDRLVPMVKGEKVKDIAAIDEFIAGSEGLSDSEVQELKEEKEFLSDPENYPELDDLPDTRKMFEDLVKEGKLSPEEQREAKAWLSLNNPEQIIKDNDGHATVEQMRKAKQLLAQFKKGASEDHMKKLEKYIERGERENLATDLELEQAKEALEKMKNEESLRDERRLQAVGRVAIWGGNGNNLVADCSHAIWGAVDIWTLGLIPDEMHEEVEEGYIETSKELASSLYTEDGLEHLCNGALSTISAYFGPLHREWDSIGMMSDGMYGIDQGLWYTVPVHIHNRTIQRVQNIPITPVVAKHMNAAIEALKAEREQVRKYMAEDPAKRIWLVPAASYQDMQKKAAEIGM